jgi:putative DNA primase/helicase
VLAWAVQGALRWYTLGSKGLPELESGAKLKIQQRSELDNVQAWIDECCTIDADSFTPNPGPYQSYGQWCKNNGITPKQQKSFVVSLKHKGYQPKLIKREGVVSRGIAGLKLREGNR